MAQMCHWQFLASKSSTFSLIPSVSQKFAAITVYNNDKLLERGSYQCQLVSYSCGLTHPRIYCNFYANKMLAKFLTHYYFSQNLLISDHTLLY